MAKCYIYNGVKYNQKQLTQLVYDEITSNPDKYPELSSRMLKAHTQAEVVDKLKTINREGSRRNKTNGWIGVSEYMEFKHQFSRLGPKASVNIFPTYIKEERIKNTIRISKENGDSRSVEDIKKDIEAQIADEMLNTFFGEYFHDLVGIGYIKGFTSPEYKNKKAEIINKLQTTTINDIDDEDIKAAAKVDPDKTLLQLITENSAKPYTANEVMKIMEEKAKQIVERIQEMFPDSIAFSEIHMSTDKAVIPPELSREFNYKGIKGRSDLVIVDKNGDVHIIDFKVATRRYDEWFAAKQYHTEYQLGFYRQILAANGIDGSRIKLYTQPIYLEKGNIAGMAVEDLKDLLRPSEHKFARLDWKNNGTFQQNINELIPIPIKMDPEETPEVLTTIEETLGKIITYDPLKKTYGKEEFMSNFVVSEIKNGKQVWVFRDWMSHGQKVEYSSREEFTKEGGFIDKFNKRLRNLTIEQIKTIADDIKRYKDTNPGNEGYKFLNLPDNTSGTARLLNSTFGEYAHSIYERVDIPVLTELGILAFRNTSTNVINFIAVTDQNLDAVVDNNGQTTVLGNYITNDEARRLSFTPMDANCGNMELIKLMHIINILNQKDPSLFAGKEIGSLEVINIGFGQKRLGDIDQLKANYEYLTSKEKLENGFVTKEINTAEFWEQLIGYVNRCLRDEQFDETTKSILGKLSIDQRTKAEKLKVLKDAITQLKNKYEDLNWKDFGTHDKRKFNSNDPRQMVYVLLNETYTYYLGIPMNYSGEIQKWGLQFGEVIKLLTIPFISNQANNLNNGITSAGPIQGTETSSPVSVPSQTLRALYQYYDIAFIKVRQDFQKQRHVIENYTRNYITKRTSQTARFLWNNNNDIWRELMVKDVDGVSLSKSLSIRDPYTDKTLTQEQSEFLKAILWEMNKYQLNLDDDLRDLHYPEDAKRIETLLVTDSKLVSAIANGSYFYLPLRRTSDFQRVKNIGRTGLTTWFEKKLDDLKNDYDPRNLHGSRNEAMNKKFNENSINMYNAYEGLSSQQRMKYIEEQGVNDFELDLDYLISDVAFQSIRKKYFEEVLLITDALSTSLQYLQQNTDMKYDTIIEAMDDQSKVDTGQSLLPTELQDVTGAVGALKRFNSLLVLAIRPFQLIKELTYGQLTNYSRAWALKHTGSAVSAKSVFEANKVIWGQSFRKYGSVFQGEGDIADYTVCEAINKQYGIANEDLNRTVDNSTLQRTGATHNFSRWMYIANSAPDYFNRLTLFIAKMMEDECFEAHTLDKYGNLVYNFEKDKRFSEIIKYGWNSDRTDTKYLEQKALFRAMAQDFEREGIFLISVKNGKEEIKPLPRAYTIKQRNSLKEVADLAYGFYDHEAKSLIDHKIFGLLWKQFMTFLTAKTTLWFRGRPTSEGQNTSQGKFEQATRNGEKLYRYITEEANGELKVLELTESECKQRGINPKTLEPLWVWKGDYVEGLAYSCMGVLHDIFHADWKHLREDKQQLGNLKLALHDILMGWILYNILKFIFSKGTNKIKDVHPMARAILRGMQDIGPQSITSLTWEPGFYTTVKNVQSDAYKLFDEPDFEKWASKRIGAVGDFYYDIS